jgi:hypothetical protein
LHFVSSNPCELRHHHALLDLGREVHHLWDLPLQNFSSSRSCWSPCNQVWCGACYTPHPWISSKTMYLQMKQDSTGAHKKSRIASTMLGMEIIC